MTWSHWLASERERRREENLERRLIPTTAPAEPVVIRDGRSLINLSSNNYLSLAGDPRLVLAAEEGARRGAGSGSSQLVAGHDQRLAAVQEKTAAFKGSEAALILGSGYLANVGAIAALADRDTAIFSDRLNHASIVDGARLSGAEVHRYRHRDVDQLETLLARSSAERKLIVTDTVFSMDGDAAPLARLVELKHRFGAALYVDDAHGAGVFGPHGEGYAHELGLADQIDLTVGTFSKAFGAYGAYIATDRAFADHLVSTCRTLIYSTALPPSAVAAIDAAIDLVAGADDRRAALLAHAERFRARLAGLGFDTAGSSTQIVPAIVGDAGETVALAERLIEAGVLAVAIRPPTVPIGKARIRFSLMSAHTHGQLEQALAALASAPVS